MWAFLAVCHVCIASAYLDVNSCRLWPQGPPFYPSLLEHCSAALSQCIVQDKLKLLCVPGADSTFSNAGQWVSVDGACVLPQDGAPGAFLINIARQAGLPIPETPTDMLQVQLIHCLWLICLRCVQHFFKVCFASTVAMTLMGLKE